ncbi:MAG: hypothetical protein KAV18_05540 [Candidatus Omnitrophica bacterium]|nr:hypothetical protein [Candidatus Omnitrophota bacterium]MCK4423516.1 hypothetical protein [Candidatus Omnitrophota bacterium]
MKTQKENVTFRIDPQLKHILEITAQAERRSFSGQLNVALEEWVQIRDELHPQFVQDIKTALKSGKPESVWKG